MSFFDTHLTFDCHGRALVLDRPRIMGIVNVTPDSFSGDGTAGDVDAAVGQGLAMVEAGADIIDVGGESTRPGAQPIDRAEQLRRVIPVIAALVAKSTVPIAIDTSDAEVMRAAVGAGAGLINDVRALREVGAMEAAASLGMPVCLMHLQGDPATMQDAPDYDDVVGDVKRFLADRVLACEFAGIDRKRLLVDPGFGFGKTLEHNYKLLAGLRSLLDLGVPMLVGLSRKGMIGSATGIEDPAARAVGSAAAALIAVQRGAAIVRVHDVAATREALAIWQALCTHAPQRTRSQQSAPPKSGSRWLDDDD